jgi:hypothetical protein
MHWVPADVDLSIRSGDDKEIWILTNYGERPQTITLPRMMKDVLGNGDVRTVTLARYGVAVVERSR